MDWYWLNNFHCYITHALGKAANQHVQHDPRICQTCRLESRKPELLQNNVLLVHQVNVLNDPKNTRIAMGISMFPHSFIDLRTVETDMEERFQCHLRRFMYDTDHALAPTYTNFFAELFFLLQNTKIHDQLLMFWHLDNTLEHILFPQRQSKTLDLVHHMLTMPTHKTHIWLIADCLYGDQIFQRLPYRMQFNLERNRIETHYVHNSLRSQSQLRVLTWATHTRTHSSQTHSPMFQRPPHSALLRAFSKVTAKYRGRVPVQTLLREISLEVGLTPNTSGIPVILSNVGFEPNNFWGF